MCQILNISGELLKSVDKLNNLGSSIRGEGMFLLIELPFLIIKMLLVGFFFDYLLRERVL